MSTEENRSLLSTGSAVDGTSGPKNVSKHYFGTCFGKAARGRSGSVKHGGCSAVIRASLVILLSFSAPVSLNSSPHARARAGGPKGRVCCPRRMMHLAEYQWLSVPTLTQPVFMTPVVGWYQTVTASRCACAAATFRIARGVRIILYYGIC
jgi:hypothetical protein